MKEVKLSDDLWSKIIEIEKFLELPKSDNEYERLQKLLDIVLHSLLTYDLVVRKMKLDIQTSLRLLDLTSKESNRVNHFVRDQLNQVLISELEMKLREYQQKINSLSNYDNVWNEIPF